MDPNKYIDVYNIEMYRCAQEGEMQWQIRRQFLYNNQAKYPEIELVYLSQVFANIEIVGYRYNIEMMDEIEEMSEGMVRKSTTAESVASNPSNPPLATTDIKEADDKVPITGKSYPSNTRDNTYAAWYSSTWANSGYGDGYSTLYGGYPATSPEALDPTATAVPLYDPYNTQAASYSQQYPTAYGAVPIPDPTTSTDYQPLTPEKLQKIRDIISQAKCIQNTNIFLELDTCMKEHGLSYWYDLEQYSDKTYLCSVYSDIALICSVRGAKKYETRGQAFEQAMVKIGKPGQENVASNFPAEAVASPNNPVLQANTLNQNINYPVQQASTPNPNINYPVQPTSTQTQSISYPVQQTSTPTPSINYPVQSTSTPNQNINYSVPATSTPNQSINYSVQPTSTPNQSISYSVQPTSTANQSISYPVQPTSTLNYAVQQTNTLDQSTSYQAQQAMMSNQSINYPVQQKTIPNQSISNPYQQTNKQKRSKTSSMQNPNRSNPVYRSNMPDQINSFLLPGYDLKQPQYINKKQLSNLILLEKGELYSNHANAYNILRQSASFSKVDFCTKTNVENIDGVTLYRCSMFFYDELFAEALDDTAANSQVKASVLALDRLKDFRPTIRVKESAADRTTIIRRSDIFGEENKKEEFISDTNIGNRLLRKMGWSGGAIGKIGNPSSVEPIRLAPISYNRLGLGYENDKPASTLNNDFRQTIRNVVEKFSKNSQIDDLVFHHDFSHAELASIHKVGIRYNLMVCHRDEGPNHFLVISHNKTSQELFKTLMKNGGISGKYELIKAREEFKKFMRY